MAISSRVSIFVGAALVAGVVLGMTVWRDSPTAPAESTLAPSTPSAIVTAGVWARPSTGKTGAAYMALRNEGAGDDRLVGAASPVAETAEIHDMTMDGTIMRMRKLDGLDVAAGAEIAIAPGGLHIMLIGLKAPLVEGETFLLTLTFAKAGDIEVTAMVQRAAPQATPHAAPDASGEPAMEMHPADAH